MDTHMNTRVRHARYVAAVLLCALAPAVATAEEESSGITVAGKVKAGATGLASVRLMGLPGHPLTGDEGEYAVEVPPGWSGTVVPALWGYTFAPAAITYIELTDPQTQDFVATPQVCTINGSVTQNGNGLAGVAMSGLPGNPITDENGAFAARASVGWAAIVAPVLEGYSFTPAAYTFQGLCDDFTMAFTARTQTPPEEPVETSAESSAESAPADSGDTES